MRISTSVTEWKLGASSLRCITVVSCVIIFQILFSNRALQKWLKLNRIELCHHKVYGGRNDTISTFLIRSVFT